MIIKDARAEDLMAISKINALGWKEAYDNLIPQEYLNTLNDDFRIDRFGNWIEKGILTVKAAWVDNELIGCIAYGKARDKMFEPWGEVTSLYISPNHWSKGYGKTMMLYALKGLIDMGFETAYLWVLEGNDKAIKFYKKLGFIFTGTKIPFEILDKEIYDLIYKLDLKNLKIY